MVLALNTIWNEGDFELRIENYRDHWGQDIAPFRPAFIGARWVDKGRGRTVLTIRDPLRPQAGGAGSPRDASAEARSHRRTAVLSFEDIRWQLVVTGDVEGGPVTVDVDGNKDFDLVVRADGQVSVRCLGGSFNANDMEVVLRTPPLQGALEVATGGSEYPCQSDADPCFDLVSPTNGPSSSGSPLTLPCSPSGRQHSQSLCAPPPRQFPPASYAMSDISPELAMLLEELRADQRAVLQKEFQLVGASFGERLWSGGRKLLRGYEPKEFLPLTALINALVIPAIFLFTYLYNHRRHRRSLACSSLFPSPDRPGAERRPSPGQSTRAARRASRSNLPSGCTTDGVAVARVDTGEDDDGLPPPPYYPD